MRLSFPIKVYVRRRLIQRPRRQEWESFPGNKCVWCLFWGQHHTLWETNQKPAWFGLFSVGLYNEKCVKRLCTRVYSMCMWVHWQENLCVLLHTVYVHMLCDCLRVPVFMWEKDTDCVCVSVYECVCLQQRLVTSVVLLAGSETQQAAGASD